MLKKIIIREINELKRGFGKNNRPWVLYKVVDVENTQYTTFEDLKAFVGRETEQEVEEKVNGKFTNLTIVSKKAAERAQQTNSALNQVMSKLEAIENKLDSIQLALNKKPVEDLSY